VLFPTPVPEVVADDRKVVLLDLDALLVDLVVEPDEMVAPVEVLLVDTVVDVDPL
jgi:hypothetical protein